MNKNNSTALKRTQTCFFWSVCIAVCSATCSAICRMPTHTIVYKVVTAHRPVRPHSFGCCCVQTHKRYAMQSSLMQDKICLSLFRVQSTVTSVAVANFTIRSLPFCAGRGANKTFAENLQRVLHFTVRNIQHYSLLPCSYSSLKCMRKHECNVLPVGPTH